MRKSVIILVIFLFYSTLLIAQNKEIINKYRPTESDLYKTLNQGIKSETVKYIRLFYNEEGTYSYTKKRYFDGKGKILVFQIYNDKPEINLTLKNLTLSNFEKVIFNLFNVTNIIIDSCKFSDIKNGVKFEYKETVNRKDASTSILISNSSFIDDELGKNKALNYYQIQFLRNKYAKGLSVLKNVTIENCNFELNDSSKSWLIKSAQNTYPKRYSIMFYRNDINAAYSNIRIENNNFEALSPFYRTEAISFLNLRGGNFRNAKDLYSHNQNISIISNIMNTNSEDPLHGIFIQGPYKIIDIRGNKIYNYGASLNDGTGVYFDGAVHIYGARNAKYSNDNFDVTFSNNIIESVGTGLNISGGSDIVAKNNTIKILSLPSFYKNNKLTRKTDLIGIRFFTGDYLDKEKQISKITLEENKILCNDKISCVGIVMQSSKDFIIMNNIISNPTSYGILVFGHKGEKELNIGDSKIIGNRIDYGRQNYKSLKSNFYSKYTGSFAAIEIHRMDNGQKYKDESLTIAGNKIIDKSNTIPKLSIVDKTKSKLKKSTKSDMKIEN